jgi:hypothetical protein
MFHDVAVASTSADLLSFDPYHSTPLSLGVYNIFIFFSLIPLPTLYSLLLCSPPVC